jgi:hypothetical protein
MKSIFVLLLIGILNMYFLITDQGTWINYVAVIAISLSMMIEVTNQILEMRNKD